MSHFLRCRIPFYNARLDIEGLAKDFKTFAFSRDGDEILTAFSKVAKGLGLAKHASTFPVTTVKAQLGPHLGTSSKRLLEDILAHIPEYSKETVKKVRSGRSRVLVCGAGPVGLRVACGGCLFFLS